MIGRMMTQRKTTTERNRRQKMRTPRDTGARTMMKNRKKNEKRLIKRT